MTVHTSSFRASEIPPDTAVREEIAGRVIAIYNLGGNFHATDDTCTHALASLSQGEISGDEIICPLHFATFNIKTGQCTGGPAVADLHSYPVRVVNDQLQIEVEI